MFRLALYGTVVTAGAAVLAVEILGTRVLGPFYGVSLFLWSALITVTLLSLSLGYWLGGRWADRGPRLDRLGLMPAAAGVWLLLLPWLRRPILSAVEPLGLRPALLLAALALFALPLIALGMVSPYALRLRVRDVDEVGRTAGRLSAFGSLAGVVAALATGFWLLPELGVSRLTQLVGGLLLLIGAIDLGVARRRLTAGSALVLFLLLLAVGFAVAGKMPRPALAVGASEGRLVAQEESPYADVRVIETEAGRHLLIDGSIHTLVDPETGLSLFRYVPVIASVRLLFDRPGRMLLLGLGGGSIARDFAAAGWSVDAVEIDPVVAEFAHRYFGLQKDDARVSIRDGREFLRSSAGPYEVIVFDAFGSGAIPFHLATEECFRLAASRLAPGGVVALNLEAVGWEDSIIGAFTRTLRGAFADALVLPTAEPPDAFGNVVVLASDHRIEVPEERLDRPFFHLAVPAEHFAAVQRNHAWDNSYRPPDAGRRLGDDRSAIELYAEQVNRAARRKLHETPGLSALAW